MKKVVITMAGVCLAAGLFLLGSCGGENGEESFSAMLVSADPSGVEGNGESGGAAISSDGRYVVFQSDASNLVEGDGNDSRDIFVRDMEMGITSRVSVSTAGTEGNSVSGSAAVSSDGRYAAFESAASNLVGGDDNDSSDIFVRDMEMGITSRVSVSTAGTEGDANSYNPAISLGGRYVAFASTASNLAGTDPGSLDVFVRDTLEGEEITSRISVSTAGTAGDGASGAPAISAGGRYVAFRSAASNLVADDANGVLDIFVRDMETEITARVSVSTAGTEANGENRFPGISADGRYVVFQSAASNLVADDANGFLDVFVRDLQDDVISRVSVSTEGTEADGDSTGPSISPDGRYVAFQSEASNLVADDTNGVIDVFVHDTETGTTVRVSMGAAGEEADGDSTGASISADGRYLTFASKASNMLESPASSGVSQVYRVRWQ